MLVQAFGRFSFRAASTNYVPDIGKSPIGGVEPFNDDPNGDPFDSSYDSLRVNPPYGFSCCIDIKQKRPARGRLNFMVTPTGKTSNPFWEWLVSLSRVRATSREFDPNTEVYAY